MGFNMRPVLTLAALTGFAMALAAPSYAATFMWCQAEATGGAEPKTFFSDIFPAEASETKEKTDAFKAEAQKAAGAGATVTATCATGDNVRKIMETRDKDVEKKKGEVLDWAG